MVTLPEGAVEAAQVAEDALEQALRAQQDSDSAHEDFYTYGAILRGVLRYTGELATVLSHQVSHYGDDFVLRADDDSDPYQRLAEATFALTMLRQVLDGEGYAMANEYQSAIGHVAVEVNPA